MQYKTTLYSVIYVIVAVFWIKNEVHRNKNIVLAEELR